MSANKRRRSNSNSSSTTRMGTADQMNAAKDVRDVAAGDNGLHKFDASSVDELLEMPRVCRCCCKGDMELLSLFEASDEAAKLQTSTKTQRLRKSTITATTASEATQQRKSDNPVDYALSGAHSGMDIVREEMIIWMLNISYRDGLPQEICRQCKAQFIMVAKFRRRCLRVQLRLEEYAKNIAERKQRLAAKLGRRAQLSDVPAEDYLHLPESQAERKRRLLLGIEQPQPQPKVAKTEADVEVPTASSVQHLQLRARKMRTASLPGNRIETEPTPTPATRSVSQQGEVRLRGRTPHRSPTKRMHVPWKTKAARKQLSETLSSCSTMSNCGTDTTTPDEPPKVQLPTLQSAPSSETETESSSGQTSLEQLSDLSVNPCLGFDIDGHSYSSSTSSSSYASSATALTAGQKATTPKSKRKFPPKRRSPKKSPMVVRCGRKLQVNSVPLKRSRRITGKKKLQQIVKNELCDEGSMEQCSNTLAENSPQTTVANETLEKFASNSSVDSSETAASTAADRNAVNTIAEIRELREQQEQICTSPAPSEPIESSLDAAVKETEVIKPIGQMDSISKEANVASEIEMTNGIAESADSTVQFEELTSSTTEQGRQSLTPEVPAAESEIELHIAHEELRADEEGKESELKVSIPLEVLDDDLQRKLCSNTDALVDTEQQETEPKEPAEADDVNNNENGENFCQSATADSFNSAVALTTNQIEAEPNGGVTVTVVATLDDDMESLERLVNMQQHQPVNVNEMQLPRASTANSMDFLAEFEKHCEKTLKLQSQSKSQAQAQSHSQPQESPLNVELELVEAKQQLEVEMNDVESTLHGILNEMQDQHLYTPVCTPIDELLTPADYVVHNEAEAPVATPAATQLYEPPAEASQMQQQQQQQQQQQVKEGNLFDSSNFSNELIGFQNDMPCFENIEATAESTAAQQSLQLELTQLLNDLQPAQQPLQQSLQPTVQQQQLQMQPETVSYESLYPVASANSSKLQVIQMQPQETLWQAPATTTQPTTGAQLQWSTVSGLEAIKTAPVAGVDALDGSGTTTYYISAGDLYQTQLQSQTAQLTGNGYALLDSNENYLLEQQEPQQQTQPQQQQQQLQHQQQPIMILIQQPELQQPVASASNPQQPPLHITYGASLSNELHAAYPQQQLQPHLQQQQQQQQQQQHQEMQSQPQRLQQQVQNTVLSTPPAAVPPPTRGRPPVLKCRFCQNGPRFSSSLEYSRHIIELHPPVAPFNCPHCPMAFAGRNKRNQHILSNHMVQQFQCGQCSQLLPSQRALDLHLQRFHMPLPTEPPADAAPAAAGVRLEEVHLQIANNNNNHSEQHKQLQQQQQQQHHQHIPSLESQTSCQQPRRTRILCCPDCEDCSSVSGNTHGRGQASYEELSNLQPPPNVLTPPSTIASLPSPQPAPHITLPSPEQSEPDSTTATLRQFRKRCIASNCTSAGAASMATSATTTTTAATTMLSTAPSPSPSSSPSSSTMETSTTLQLGKLRSNHQCAVCEKHFTNIIALRKHQQLAHDSQTTMPWVCGICKRGYRKRTDMDNHMKSHEPKGRPYECNECWVRFPEFKQLAMHKFTVHELIKPHTCDECGKQFGTESALKTHIKFHGAHINTHLPLGVFLNDKMPSSVSSKLENPSMSATVEESSLPLTPLSNCNGNSGSIDDCPGSVELVESSMTPSLDMTVNTP
ncbi:uncharacterized protein LOC6574238 isoform X1 [Drosophila mojavensis]|uniref:uncharacterized protein LOC6574238 isoform X1 n=2 Tax=Drosophila mojavensis TaxID=7230 RepID=UPI001CD09640|nr:uncharacterized protein LOC6574238 isoform X1 [Drosophila mojavensis]XP_043864312.1 uncharacterized protein LOC6574238 isoform X1 [Drosophila mojavensis]XP_043864313.1 uncharacterized protein LOC6574238 isoform X1 [Drosophila mojavensis]XP_043864314.1 uncharacterized protein LOC6574238 isoform X1 [Drosophila mojavensis]